MGVICGVLCWLGREFPLAWASPDQKKSKNLYIYISPYIYVWSSGSQTATLSQYRNRTPADKGLTPSPDTWEVWVFSDQWEASRGFQDPWTLIEKQGIAYGSSKVSGKEGIALLPAEWILRIWCFPPPCPKINALKSTFSILFQGHKESTLILVRMCNVLGLETINICILRSYEPYLVAVMSFTRQSK